MPPLPVGLDQGQDMPIPPRGAHVWLDWNLAAPHPRKSLSVQPDGAAPDPGHGRDQALPIRLPG